MITVGAFTIGGPDESDAAIRLYPSSRFTADHALLPDRPYGYGHQPDTAQFLRLIEQMELTGKRVVDVGAGTGILAFAAAKRGAIVTAFEQDAPATELLRRHVELNGLAITMKGKFPDEWDGVPFDVAFANLGVHVVPTELAPAIYLTHEDGAQIVRLQDISARDLRKRMKLIAENTRQHQEPEYPKQVHHAREHLLGAPSPFLDPGQWEQWVGTVEYLHRHAQEALAEAQDDEPHISRLLARGNLGKLQKRDYLRQVGAATGTHWSDVTVNLMTMSCGCQHEQWFTDSSGPLKTLRHHQARLQCVNHPGEPRLAWRTALEQSELVREAQVIEPDVEVELTPGRVIVRPTNDQVEPLARLLFGRADWWQVDSIR